MPLAPGMPPAATSARTSPVAGSTRYTAPAAESVTNSVPSDAMATSLSWRASFTSIDRASFPVRRS